MLREVVFIGKILDKDIRNILHNKLKNNNSLVLDELWVYDSRIDITEITDCLMIGYEIKSERDTLNRLESQIKSYNKAFNKVYLVACTKHIQKAISIIPEWWGVIEVIKSGSKLILKTIRESQQNFVLDAYCLSMFLWKNECIKLLEKYQLMNGNKNKPKYALWEIIAENIKPDEIQKYVIDRFKNRKS